MGFLMYQELADPRRHLPVANPPLFVDRVNSLNGIANAAFAAILLGTAMTVLRHVRMALTLHRWKGRNDLLQ